MIPAIQQIDDIVFHAVNGLAGNWAIDRVIYLSQENPFFKGGLVLATYWWFWFSGSGDRRDAARKRLVAAIIGAFASLVLARTLANLLPFRVRPMIAPESGFHPLSLQIPALDLENWSSFPSDHAALFFALAFGIFTLSRLMGVLLMVHAAVWVCLPRLYVGVHYPSDLIAGALIGVAATWACMAVMDVRGGALGRMVMAPILAVERRWPQAFYAAMFALSFEIAMMFDDVRNVMRNLVHGLHGAGYLSLGEGSALFLLCGVALGIAVLVCVPLAVWWLRKNGEIRSRAGRHAPVEH